MKRIASDVFRPCASDDGADGLEGNARMEIRVPLSLADAVLVVRTLGGKWILAI